MNADSQGFQPCLWTAFMRFASIDPFVGAAKRTQIGFDFFHQPESRAALSLSGAPADQAVHAEFGQGFVELGWFLDAHVTAIYPFLRGK
jgi:hypothetical protein